ncbi:MAG: hypothetical protein FIA95_16015 [Gemmatimonadetes bacterium]|nr:hypothetical protein [Gemmatimonadota bacterium]
MTQHASLTPERWARFTLDQQILQVGAEMHRASASMARGDAAALRNGYERVLRLLDLTAQVSSGYRLRRELLRWRDLIAELYISDHPDEEAHRAAFRVLLLMRPEAAKQIPYLLGG